MEERILDCRLIIALAHHPEIPLEHPHQILAQRDLVLSDQAALDDVEMPEVPAIITDQPVTAFAVVDDLFRRLRNDRERKVPYIGYPVRLRKHRSANGWEGFFLESVFMFSFDDEALRPGQKSGHGGGASSSPDYPKVAKPERISYWEHVLHRRLSEAGLRPILQLEYTEALKWYRKPAEQGSMEALFTVGTLYSGGKSKIPGKSEAIAKEVDMALKCFVTAVNTGHAGAQRVLGLWYRDGTPKSQGQFLPAQRRDPAGRNAC